jgi:hypothetical protein
VLKQSKMLEVMYFDTEKGYVEKIGKWNILKSVGFCSLNIGLCTNLPEIEKSID